MHTGNQFFQRLRFVITICCVSTLLSGCISFSRSGVEAKRADDIEFFYQKWQGTGYQYGGTNGGGIDCSALMVEAYDDLYHLNLPRTTEDQSNLGKRVRMKNLKSGDLVFFKTGITRRHVGIYLDDGLFVHASRSKGVIKSSLGSDYWSKHFWKAKRLLN